MAEVSDQLLVVTIMAYLAALVAYAAEYAFGTATRVSLVANRELVGAGGPAVDSPDLATADPSEDASADSSGFGTASAKDRYIGLAVIGLSVAATLAHAATLITRAVAAGRVPWGNMYEFLLALTLVGSVAWLVVLFVRPAVRALGLLVTTVVIVLLGTSGMLHTDAGPLVPALNSYWLAIHVSAVATAGGVLLVGFVSAVLYLLRDGFENGRTGFPFALAAKAPAAATIERLTFRVHAFAFPILTVGIMCGAIWAEAAWGRYWGWDPKEVWSFITWVIYAGYLHARATPSIKRRTASWLAIAGWAAVVFNTYGVNLVFSGLHSYAGV